MARRLLLRAGGTGRLVMGSLPIIPALILAISLMPSPAPAAGSPDQDRDAAAASPEVVGEPGRLTLAVNAGRHKADQDPLATIQQLVRELCKVVSAEVLAEPDAYTVYLALDEEERGCLDEVSFSFDRRHPDGRQILFEVTPIKEKRGMPVLHISTIHTGTLPYIHLRDGKTLFVGAIVDGWELISISDDSAAFSYGDRVFRLQMNGNGVPQ